MVSAPSGSVLFGSVLALIGGLVLAFSARYVWRATAVRRARKVSSLADTPPGTLVRVSGTAKQASDLLTAPFSGQDCLALRYAVEERRLSPGLLPWFVTLHETAGSNPFRVRTSETVVDVVYAASEWELVFSEDGALKRGECEGPRPPAWFPEAVEQVEPGLEIRGAY